MISKFESIINLKKKILNESLYKKAGVSIPIIKINNVYHIIFEKRAFDIPQGGEISLPGGKFDQNDTSLEQTALRETIEELNIEKKSINMLGSIGSIITRIRYLIEVFPAIISDVNIEDIDFNRDEVEKIITVPISYFLHNRPETHTVLTSVEFTGNDFYNLNIPKKYKGKMPKQKNIVYVYKYSDENIIWGVTAEIIFNFIELLKTQNEDTLNAKNK